VALFRELPPRKVEISLYGSTAKTHDAVTGIPGSHTLAWEGLHRLQAAGIRVVLKTVLMKANLHEFEAMEAQAQDLGVGFRHDAAIFPCLEGGSRAPLAFRVPPEEVVRRDMATPERRRIWREKIEKTAARPESHRLYTCSAGQTFFHADPFGNLSPCLMAENYSQASGGRPFQEVWNGDLAEIRYRSRTRSGGSFSGDLRGACTHCPAFNQLETGDEEQESDYMKQTTMLRYAAAMSPETGETP
jgi:MoaA/NifB/PqqE/SkfB family radical SAM enzyme